MKELSISKLIGNTPLVAIRYIYKGKEQVVYTKLEYYNFTGSIKDRTILNIIFEAFKEGKINSATKIIEATSGNTGISVSAITSAIGCKAIIFMPDWMSKERIKLMEAYGAEVKLISKEEGGFLECKNRSQDLAKQPNSFLTNQFSNFNNIDAHYKTTGPEIYTQLASIGLKPNSFVAGIGTGGTIMGVGKYFKEQDINIQINPLEPSNSPTLSEGVNTKTHRIQGLNAGFIPEIVDLSKLDDIVSVDDGDSIIMAQMLSKKLGLGVGISSGANFLGAIKIKEKLNNDAVVVTVFPDDNKKYLSTALFSVEEKKKGFLTNDMELLGLGVCV